MNFTSSCLLLGSLKFFYPSYIFCLSNNFTNVKATLECKICVNVNDACLSQLYKPWVSKDGLVSVSPVGVQLKCVCVPCPPFSQSPNKQWGSSALGVRQSHHNLPLWFPEKIAVGRNIYAIKKESRKKLMFSKCLLIAWVCDVCVVSFSLHYLASFLFCRYGHWPRVSHGDSLTYDRARGWTSPKNCSSAHLPYCVTFPNYGEDKAGSCSGDGLSVPVTAVSLVLSCQDFSSRRDVKGPKLFRRLYFHYPFSFKPTQSIKLFWSFD